MDRAQVIIAITLLFAAIASFPTAQRSKKQLAVYGGMAAEVFHHLSTIAYLAIIPAGLLGSLFVGPAFGVPLALGFLALAFIALFFYAIIEKPARPLIADSERGWTQEDARTSGL